MKQKLKHIYILKFEISQRDFITLRLVRLTISTNVFCI